MESWFAVRCLFRLDDPDPDRLYEERITLWRAESADAAIEEAEQEAREYAEGLGTYLGFAQSFWLFDPPDHGREVFSLVRGSELEPTDYIDTFFDTGTELQRGHDEDPP